MGFIIDFIIKMIGLRKFFAITLFALKGAFFASLFGFFVALGVAIGKMYFVLYEIADSLFGSSLGGTVGGNDINAIVWSLLESLGILGVFETFIPILFSTIVGYLSLYLTGIILTFQKNVYRAIQDFGVIYLG